MQIDSLNRENELLKKENKVVRSQYREATKKIDDLAGEKEALSEKVELASQLDAMGIKLQLLRKNGKSTDKIKKAKQIAVNFTIAKNVTSSTGEKIAYIRIMQPDQEPLVKSAGDTFMVSQIVDGEPLTLRCLVHEGMEPTNYVCGRVNGVKYRVL